MVDGAARADYSRLTMRIELQRKLFVGVRIDNKRIEEGDTFTICDYELKFTYR